MGKLTDRLTSGSGPFPLYDLTLLATYRYLGSSSGWGLVHTWASTRLQQTSRSKMAISSYSHMMGLSYDFHLNKDTSEVIRSVNQAESISQLNDLAIFEVFPAIIDLIIAMVYVAHKFTPSLATLIFAMGVVYLSLALLSTSWARLKRQKWLERSNG